jgi:DNA-binding response OmpR family regulator
MTARRERIATVVVCEGDGKVLIELCDRLAEDDFDVLPASGAVEALRLCRYIHPDLLLLDGELPDGAASDVIRVVREEQEVGGRYDPRLPIIVLGDRGGEDRRAYAGADDYLRRPVSFEELRARIGTTLRRRRNAREDPITVGEIVIDPSRRTVTVGGREVRLAKKEFLILCVLAAGPTHVFSKDELLRDVWGAGTHAGRVRSLDSHMSRLRNKLDGEGQRYVVNCWGVGYSLVSGPGQGLR